MKTVIENKIKKTVIIGENEIEGFIDDSKNCPKCLENRVYYDDYDSFFVRGAMYGLSRLAVIQIVNFVEADLKNHC